MFRTASIFTALFVSAQAEIQVFQAFEGDGYNDWKVEGTAFGLAPIAGKSSETTSVFAGYAGDSLAASTHGGDDAKGSLTSPEFSVKQPYIALLIAGGDTSGKTAAQLIVDGQVVREAMGARSFNMTSVVWNVADLAGKSARIALIDDATGEWGFIAVDQVLLSDQPDPKVPPTTVSEKSPIQDLIPSSIISSINIPAASTLKVEATFEEHKLTSPTALTFDDEGRIYISETHRFRRGGVEDDRGHLYWYLDDLANMTTADRRAMHEKWQEKLSIEQMTSTSEVIRTLHDTDGDGTLDENKVFAEGFKDLLDGTAAGVFYYEGSLFFACIPKIWELRDTNGDGIADERKTIQDGFGVRVSLSGHDLNGFTLGPDGRIYGTIGDRGLNLVTKEGVSYKYPNEGAAFRFEPDGSDFELFHTGLRNPKELSFDALGNPFSVDNNSDQADAARIVYLVEGGDSGWQMEHQAMHSFHRQIGLEERPTSRWMDEKIWETVNPIQPAFIVPPAAYLSSGPSGLTYHPGTGFLESEKDRFLICDYRGGAANSGIWSFQMKPKGAGMDLADARQFLWGVAASDVEYSWDGRVFVTDFITGWTSHDAGRLLSLNAGENTWRAQEAAQTAKLIREGFNQRESQELGALLNHPDFRVRLRAQVALTRKPDALARFSETVASPEFTQRLHGIWGLGILARRGSMPSTTGEFAILQPAETRQAATEKLVSLLADTDPEIRAQVLKTLGDSASSDKPLAVGPFLKDPSARVRFFAAILAGKSKDSTAFDAICEMLAANNDSDVYLRHAGAFALQNIVSDSKPLAALNSHPSASVRLAATVALRRMSSPDVSSFVFDAEPKVADEAIRAITDLDLKTARPFLATRLDSLEKRSWLPFMLKRLLHNSFRVGDAENAARLLSFAANPSHPEAERKEALRLISIWTNAPPVDQLTAHHNPLPARDPATLLPALSSALPALLKQDGFALTAALALITQYHPEIAGLDETSFRKIINNQDLPAAARANALKLYVERRPAELDSFLTSLTDDASDEVALAAFSSLAEISPSTAIAPLEKLLNGTPSPRTQKAWGILASLPGDAIDSFFTSHLGKLRESNGVSVHAIELLAAAKLRKSAVVSESLTTLEQALASSSDPLAKWNASLEGGDPKAGEALFKSHPTGECMRCHRAEEGHTAGGETAPNLLGIASRHTDRRYFLESMIKPSQVLASGFGTVLVDFKNGASLSGNLLAETPEHLDIDFEKKPRRITRSDIASVTPPVSPMPAMNQIINPGDLRDLVAWLASLNQGGVQPIAAATPEMLDPSALPIPEKSAALSAIDPAFLKLGQQQSIVCSACHGQQGEGTAAGPPLAGSEWVNGPVENLIRIQLRGLQGPIKVKGVEYNFPAGMAALSYQTDEQIAAVLTYMRNSFGNTASAVTPAEVTALRSEVGKPAVTVADLISPFPKAAATSGTALASIATPPAVISTKYDNLPSEVSFNKWTFILSVGAVALLTILMFKKKSVH